MLFLLFAPRSNLHWVWIFQCVYLPLLEQPAMFLGKDMHFALIPALCPFNANGHFEVTLETGGTLSN